MEVLVQLRVHMVRLCGTKHPLLPGSMHSRSAEANHSRTFSKQQSCRRDIVESSCSGPSVVGAGTNGRQQLTSKSTVQSLSSLGRLLYRSGSRREFEVSYEVMHDVFGAFSTTCTT